MQSQIMQLMTVGILRSDPMLITWGSGLGLGLGRVTEYKSALGNHGNRINTVGFKINIKAKDYMIFISY